MEQQGDAEIPSQSEAPISASAGPTWLRRLSGPLLSVVMLLLALWALQKFAGEVNYHQVGHYLHRLRRGRIGQAVVLTALGYAGMTLYDMFALAAIGKRLPRARVALISFISYAFSNTLGMSVLVSGSIRYRFYIQAGLSTAEVAKVVLFCTLSFWLGLCAVTGSSLLLEPISPQLPFAALHVPVGLLLLSMPLLWLFGGLFRRRPLSVLGRWQVTLPSTGTAWRQILVGALDWGLAAAVLYVLMPSEIVIDFGPFLAIFVLAQMAGLISHVPGGLGVFEAVMLAGLGATGNAPEAASILGALAAFRGVYYLLPLCVATVTVLFREARGLRQRKLMPRWFSSLLPPFFAGLTLVSGAVLLFSGATQTLPRRLAILSHVLPLPVLEVSHFLNSVVGMLLLILARGLQRRLDAAYVLTLVLLVAGAVLSLLKGIDYEEATLLLMLALALAPAHRLFYRRASLFQASFSFGWMLAVLAVLGCTFWLVLFSYQHVEYSNDLWWEFSFRHGGAPRALRALVGAASVALLFGLVTLFRSARPRPVLPDEAALGRALPLIKSYPGAQAHLALMGDKALMFDPDYRAFIMYGLAGRSWIAMGDPVGTDAKARQELVWTFHETCERAGGWPVFYQVNPRDLDMYLEVGMSLLKVGEEARVPLDRFNLDGKSKKSLRNIVSKLQREGLRLEIVAPDQVPALLPRLKPVSDAWLHDKRVREKGFSLGAFDAAYLARTPMAVVWQDDEPVAFANMFLSDSMEEASVDLMRHRPDGPPGLMDYLFVELMLWSKAQGYRWFNLGMAPLSGLTNRRQAPLWNRFGALIFGRGERFYNFRGLHRYKDKFDPEWEPRYMAVPGGIALPVVLANVAGLISGGLTGVVRR